MQIYYLTLTHSLHPLVFTDIDNGMFPVTMALTLFSQILTYSHCATFCIDTSKDNLSDTDTLLADIDKTSAYTGVVLHVETRTRINQ